MTVFLILLIIGWLAHPGVIGLLRLLKKRSLGQVVMWVGKRSYIGVILVPASCVFFLVIALFLALGGLENAGLSPVRLIFLYSFIWAGGIIAVLGITSFRIAQIREGGIADPEGSVWRWEEIKGYYWSPNTDNNYLVLVRKDEKKEVRWGTRPGDLEQLTSVLESKLPGRMLASPSALEDEPQD